MFFRSAGDFNAAGNLTLINYPSGTTDVSFAYDALGRVTNLVDAVGTTTYAYAHGLLQYEDGPWTTGTNGWTDRVTYGYNSARRRSQMILSQPAGNAWTNSYSWDAGHRLSAVSSPAGTHTYTYNGPGNQTRQLTLPGTLTLTNQFDALGRLTDTQLRYGSTILNRHGYTYNAGHQRTKLSRTNSSATAWNGYSTASYDDAGQVREVKAFDASGVSHATSSPYQPNSHAFYHADGNGNVTFLSQSNGSTDSFFLHIPSNRSSPTGPGSSIKQTICWTEPMDQSKCNYPP